VTIPNEPGAGIYADGTPNSNGQFYVDAIEIYPTRAAGELLAGAGEPRGRSGSYDGIDGMLSVAENNGQSDSRGV